MPKIPLPQRAERQPETGITVTPNRQNIGTELPTSSSGLSQSLGQLGKLFDKIAADKRAQDDLNLINRHKLDTAIRLDNLVNSEKQFQAEEAQGAEKRFLSNAARDRQRLISKLPEHLQQEASMEYDALVEIKRQSVINYENEQRKLAIENNLTNSLAYYQNIVNEDPLQFEKAMEDIDEELDYLEMANAYSPSQIEILKRDRKDKVGYTAVNAMIVNAKDSDTPEVVYDAIEANLKDTAGTFKEFVTEETREQLLQKVRDERKAWKNDQRLIKDRLEKDEKDAKAELLEAEVAKVYADIEKTIDSNSANVGDWVRLKQKMREYKELGNPDNAQTRLQLDSFINGLAKNKDLSKINDITTEANFDIRIDNMHSGTAPEEINQMLNDIDSAYQESDVTKRISMSVRNRLRARIQTIKNDRESDISSAEEEVLKNFERDRKNGVFGPEGSREGDIEHARQVQAFRGYMRNNKGADPVEYYEKVMEPQKRGAVMKVLDFFGIGEPSSEELTLRRQAIQILSDNKKVINEDTIQAIMKQLEEQ